MHASFINIFSEEVARALCWTFLHSLWQGFLLAILAAVIMLATRRQTAALRYNLLFALLSLFLIGAGLTFAHEFRAVSGIGGGERPISGIVLTDVPTPATAPLITEAPSLEGFVRYFNKNAALIVMVWFIVFLAKSVQLLSGLVHLQRIRYSHVSAPDESWRRRIAELASQLHLRVPVKLLESEIARVPVVIGALKPVILLPLGLLASLPPDQVEAILLHELAHIKRGDYFVNLLQSVAEILFFFNPAVLWVSSLIRNERENCCDDIAVGATRSKAKFINALIAFQEYSQGEAPAYATAFPGSGRKTYLLDRAKRIVNNKNKTLNNMEKFSVICCLVFVCTILVLLSAPQRSAATPAFVNLSHPAASPSPIVPDRVDTSGKPVVKTGTQRTLGNPAAATGAADQKNAADQKDAAAKDVIKELLSDLQHENLVKADELETVSLKLTNSELVINGVKQPAEIQKRMSDKYITSPSMKIMYHWWGN